MSPSQMFQQLCEACPNYSPAMAKAHRLSIHIRSMIDGDDYRIEEAFPGGIYMWEGETWEEVLASFTESQQAPFSK